MPDRKKRFEIRQMCEKDLSAVAQIEQEIFSQPWSEQGFANSLSQENTCYLVADMNGEIVGYCGFLQVLDEADITNVAIKEKYRRLGAGRSLLKVLIKEGEKRGVTAFTLEVRESNVAALKLYQTLGFESAGIRKNFYDFPKENAVIMWKYDQRFPLG